ncbi:hypothetical protein LSH36_121g02026 [Paralvinella palmiformis]|uniref:Uncharacterized protein n=1 Tax=Paralvinella palmiformis TaxID=53620 RepID=A0AAD9NBG2_9ANNE|nr:hypothetical protein LSH36_121g02026 [Paralvinella palmiformis]
MQQSERVVFIFCVLVVLIASFSSTQAFTINRAALVDPSLTEAVLEELLEAIRQEEAPLNTIEKRRIDGGYGNRYGVAQSLGSKLMALKTAADWNNPGRRKRDAAMSGSASAANGDNSNM